MPIGSTRSSATGLTSQTRAEKSPLPVKKESYFKNRLISVYDKVKSYFSNLSLTKKIAVSFGVFVGGALLMHKIAGLITSGICCVVGVALVTSYLASNHPQENNSNTA